jgi:hypothetical protein
MFKIEKITVKLTLVILMLAGFVFADHTVEHSASSGTGGLGALINAMVGLCTQARSMLGIGIMLMIILAGVIYSVGQLLGAETRARATVWATAMLLGALIGALIFVIMPPLLRAIAPDLTISC